MNDMIQQKERLAMESCHPPNGIPKQCCLGTFAGMGRILVDRRHYCAAPHIVKEQVLRLPFLVEALIHQQQPSTFSSLSSKSCDICQILDDLHEKNWTLAMVGDSMSHQIFQGLVCELYRRNYAVQESAVERFEYGNANQQHQEQQRQRQRQRQRQNQPRDKKERDTSDVTFCAGGINHCLHMVRTIHISSPRWKETVQPVTIKFFHQYRLPFANPAQEELVVNSADILMINFGLHWGANYGKNIHNESALSLLSSSSPSMELAQVTTPHHPPTPQHLQVALADFLIRIGKSQTTSPSNNHHQPKQRRVQHVLIRETTSQHFDAEGGDYSFVKHLQKKRRRQNQQHDQQHDQEQESLSVSGQRIKLPLQCVPFRPENSAGWREEAIRQAAQLANYTLRQADVALSNTTNAASTAGDDHDGALLQQQPKLTLLPYADFTQQLYQLHPFDERLQTADGGGGGGDDCTHYCSSPFLYMPLWRSLRMAFS